MKRQNLIWIIPILWLAPLLLISGVLGMIVEENNGTEISLFLFYSVFTWSIALLTFLLETSRRRLFQTEDSMRCGRRLAGYCGIAILLAYLFSPVPGSDDALSAVIVIITALFCGGVAGLVYCRIFYRGREKQSGNSATR